MPNQEQCGPTEKTLYKEPHDDHWGTWDDRLYECGNGPQKGIGIDVGGTVFVMPLKEWHGLAKELSLERSHRERLEKALKKYGSHKLNCKDKRNEVFLKSKGLVASACVCGLEEALQTKVGGSDKKCTCTYMNCMSSDCMCEKCGCACEGSEGGKV